MVPLELFERHCAQAEKLAVNLCHHYAVSGALSYQDEAKSEALLALWKQAEAFDPNKQTMQRQQFEQSYFAALLGIEVPPAKFKDPYDIFWFSAVMRVSGAVLDFFRSQRLIFKLKKVEDGKEPERTMLHYERFVSISSEAPCDPATCETIPGTLADMLPSSDRADASDSRRDALIVARRLLQDTELAVEERRVILLSYGDEECSTREIAAIMKISQPKVKKFKLEALKKLKDCAQLRCLA